jgi:hypothetical protein
MRSWKKPGGFVIALAVAAVTLCAWPQPADAG